MKKFPVSKNILTLLSVLSVLLVFSLVCMLCLLAMDKLGIVKLFGSSETEPESVPMQTEFPLPVHTEETSGASAVGGKPFSLGKDSRRYSIFGQLLYKNPSICRRNGRGWCTGSRHL